MTNVPLRASLLLLASCAGLSAQTVRQGASVLPAPHAPRNSGRLLVSGFESDAVHAFLAWDGAPRGRASNVPGAQSIVLGPDGLLYVCAEEVDQIVRIDPDTLAVLDTFVGDDPLTPADENGPLAGPTSAVFGPGGDLYVASFENDQILRFDGTSGAYEGVFVAQGLGGLNGPDAGTKFGRDGYLYVPSFWSDRVLRYDGAGEFVDEFIAFRDGGLRRPRDLVFHRAHWYVASTSNGRILRYDAAGNFVDVFATVAQPYSLAFHPLDKDLYVVSLVGNGVYHLDGESGDVLSALVTSGSGGITGAVYLFFLP